MITVRSVRDFHSQLDAVCASLEALFDLAVSDYEAIALAAAPAMQAFRGLLDAGDSIVGPDPAEEGAP